MPYLDQVEANILQARRYLADARQQSGKWPFCSSAIARALEHGACAVFIAWDEPYKASRKIHKHFDERLAPCINEAMASFITCLWEHEGSAQPDNVGQLLAACQQVIDGFEQLARDPPPAGSHRVRSRHLSAGAGWLRTSGRSSWRRAQLPGRRLRKFACCSSDRGRRDSRPDSHYDLLFVFPDTFRRRHTASRSGRSSPWQPGWALKLMTRRSGRVNRSARGSGSAAGQPNQGVQRCRRGVGCLRLRESGDAPAPLRRL